MSWVLPILGGLTTGLCVFFLQRSLHAFDALRLYKKPEMMVFVRKNGYNLPPKDVLWNHFGGNCLGFLITNTIWITFAAVILHKA